MKRTNPTTNQAVMQQHLHALQDLTRRVELLGQFGGQYGGDRNIYNALGYKQQLLFDDYMRKWSRQDIAKAVINRPVAATWNGSVAIDEGTGGSNRTPLQEDWDTLFKRLNLRFKFARLDRLTMIGHYAVLLLGLDDVAETSHFRQPVDERINHNLLYVKPYSEANADISTWDEDPRSERYGLPEVYNIKTATPNGGGSQNLLVHHSRIVHTVSECLESEVYAEPSLKAIYNRLDDIEKIVGGSAEMFWRGARPGYHASTKEGYELGSQTEEDLKRQIDEYEHKLRRILVNEGVEMNALEQQVADPLNHLDAQLQMISAEKGYPKRILVGSERGELASSEDKSQWNDVISARRSEHAEPVCLEPFTDKGIRFGFLRPPQDELDVSYSWEDLYSPSKAEQANIGQTRASALGTYAKQPMAMEIVPPDLFSEMFLGLSKSETRRIKARMDADMTEEAREMAEEEREMEDNPQGTSPSDGQVDDVSQG